MPICEKCGKEFIGYKRCPICKRNKALWKKYPDLMQRAKEMDMRDE